MRVLYIEDNRQDAELARMEIARTGSDLRMTVAGTLAAAWRELAEPERFDVVVVDLNLPDGSGLDLVLGVRDKQLPLAVIMLTGSGDERSAVAALKAGVDDYLIKQGDYLRQLPQVIESAVGAFRLGQERKSRPLRVLYAEHHALDQDLTRMHQARHAAHILVEVAASANEVLAKLEKSPDAHDVLLLDYRLAGTNALELLRLISKDGTPRLPVVLVTGQGDEIVAVEALQLGASDYIVKRPGYLHELASTLENARNRALLVREQAALRASESSRRLREEALDALPQGVLLSDADRRIIYANPAFTRLTGYAAAEVLGRNCALLQGPETDPATVARMRAALQAGAAFDGELVNYRKDGTRFRNHLSLTPVRTSTGALVNYIGLSQDVSERWRIEDELRASEERFRQIAENIHEVFWMTDPANHQMLYISPAYEQIWGRRCADIMRNPSDWLKAIHPDDRGRVSAAAKRQIAGDYHEVYRVVRPDESIRWVRERAFPIRDADGHAYRIVGTAEDITEHRKLESRFIQAQKMEAIGTLAGGIAHDFNNILAAIMGYTELMRMQIKGQPQVEDYLQALLKASGRAAALVRQILAFSRQGEHERKPMSLARVVAEPLAMLRATLPTTIEFDVKLDEDLPFVMVDVTQIHQVLMNLCTNAAHAMKDRQGRLGIRLEACEVTRGQAASSVRLREGPHVRLTVSDNGQGMTREVVERIFEPFFTTKAPGEGTGLGLAVVHGIMQTHDGEVMVQSTPGKGTTFELYFPVHTQSDGEAAVCEAEDEVPRGAGERVLFIDDEPALAQLGQSILEALGYRVLAVSDAPQALECVRAGPQDFDLVVTDLSMPEIMGTDLAALILEINPDMPVILTTGYTSNLTSDSVRALGIRELLLKPFSFHSLGTTVHQVLASKIGKS